MPATLFAQEYLQNILVTPNSDPNLKNPWGIARGTGGPWWVSDNVTGVSTLYNGSGVNQGLVVTIPHAAGATVGSPTGIVFNGDSGFAVTPGNPGVFIFVSIDGTISAWNPSVNLHKAIQKVPGLGTSVLTGATIAQIGTNRFLYVADLEGGNITVYDTHFIPVNLGSGAFQDSHVPVGFAPFNIQNIGNNLYVAYAQQDAAKTFVNFGPGLGFVDVFSPQGQFLMQLQAGDWFNAPWGLVLAPSDFGAFSHKILVGQFGTGQILAFDAVTGAFEGKLRDQTGKVLSIGGPGALWALAFGDGETNSDPVNLPGNALYFTAGPAFPNGGLFGTLTPVAGDLIQGNDQ